MSNYRERYNEALESGDLRRQIESLEGLAGEAIRRGETLAAPRLVEEAFETLMRSGNDISRISRARIGSRLIRVWLKSAARARRDGIDPSKYWFFRT